MGKGMKAGKKPKARPSGNDMQKQLRQLQAMQAEMEKAQDEIAEKEVSATAGGGAVEVTVNGNHEITRLTLSNEVVDPDDIEMLQDLVIAAVNEAMRQMDELAESEMNKITGGLGGMGGGLGFPGM